ncbi:MAG: hypothetical protein ACHQ3O_04625 [Candidatus Limnocylindria bacterium]
MRPASTSDAMLAALPLAAGFTVQLVRALPIRFVYRENSLGIVSLATLQRYPLQQETFWLIFAALAIALLAWGLARALLRAGVPAGTQASAEAFAVLGLLLALWLPGAAGALGCGAAAAAALALVRRASRLEREEAAPARPERRGGAASRWALAALAALLCLVLTPGIWINFWNVVRATPDVQLVADDFNFHAEIGQHLAWADAIRRGDLHGRDFFCLYGPLYDLGVVGMWELTGRSIAAYRLYVSLGRVAGYAVALLLCAALVRRKSLLLVVLLLLPYVDLRIGLPLAGLLLLALWRQREKIWLSLAAGLVAGSSLLYSQEFGLAFVLTAAVGFAVTRAGRAAAAFSAGLAVPLALVLGWFAAHGALGAMLNDVVQYPRYMVAGYAKRIFPSLVANLPLRLAALEGPEALVLCLGYSAPFLCWAALLIAVPVAALRLRHPLVWMREAADTLARDPLRFATALLALFGALAFRSALGRTDLLHILMVTAPPALLVVIGIDRLIGAWITEPARRGLVATRAVALILLVLASGLLDKATPARALRYSRDAIVKLARGEYAPRGNPHVQQVWRWVLLNAEPDEPVLFLPDFASYYYLTRRPSPIRFVLGHQIVTDAHRAEVLATLRARPPRYIVWDDGLLAVDAIKPRVFLGAPLFDWIERSYQEETRIGTSRVLRLREPAG